MLYQVILFDLDNTLIDFTDSEIISLNHIYRKYYSTIEYAVFENHFRDINSNLWKRVGAREKALMPNDIRLSRFKQLNQKLACNIPAEQIAHDYERNLAEHAQWFPDVKTVIEFLHQKGHILGIVTNGLVEVQNKKQQRLALHQWFDCFIVSDGVGIAKPNKEIFAIALQEIASKRNQPIHSFNKNSVLMVGDSLESDGHGAMSFGIGYCFINNKAIEVVESAANITYNIRTVAHLPFHIGYEDEYALFLKSRIHASKFILK